VWSVPDFFGRISADSVRTNGAKGTAMRAGGKRAAKGTPSGDVQGSMSRRHLAPADVAFRDPDWQSLHAAALRIMAQVVATVRAALPRFFSCS